MSNALKFGNNQTLASVLDLYRLSLMYQMNCHQVGEIVSFNPSTQTAEVQIKMVRVEDDQIKEYPLLIDCPCVLLSGGKGRLTFPIEQGDSCIVLFNDRDIDNWYASGQKMPPRTPRMHNFADAIALVGIRNKQNQIEDYLKHGVELKYGQSTIKLENNKVTITDHKDTIVMDNGNINITGNVNIVQNTVDDNSLHAYIISSYHSGASWYRVWSDKWCEQGTSVTASSGTWNFLKPFKDTDYQAQISIWRTSSSSSGWNYHLFYNDKTPSSIGYVNADLSLLMLYACGYIN